MAPRHHLSTTAALLALLWGVCPALHAQDVRLDTIPVAVVDLYGLSTVSEVVVRRALAIAPGAPIPDSAARAAAIARVESIAGVRSARFNAVCCADSRGLLVYVGIEEEGAPTFRFAPAPTSDIRLPDEVVAAGEAFAVAFADAVAHGDFAETDTAGHAIMHWPAAGAVQRRFVDLAAEFASELRNVLHNSAHPEQRALAAQVLGYAPDKAAVVSDLSDALHDQDETVRNNAARVLALIALLAQRRPELGIEVPYEAFLAMLQSPVWTDRNKASFALAQLTTNRDPELISILRQRSLPALLEMARWNHLGHAGPALTILGRIAGLPEAEISAELAAGNRGAILAAAEEITDGEP